MGHQARDLADPFLMRWSCGSYTRISSQLFVMLGPAPGGRRRRHLLPKGLPRHLLVTVLALTFMSAAAQAHPYFLFKALAFVGGNAKIIAWQASRTYRQAPRSGTCAERRDRFLQLLPEALRLGRYARDIYEHGEDLKDSELNIKDQGDGYTAYYDPNGERYAEVRVDATRLEAIVIFRGARHFSGSDISAGAMGLVGIETTYYRWGSALVAEVVREHPGMHVIVTGHSLGGGLVLYAVLHNHGVQGVAFNPVGLSRWTWLRTNRSERMRANGALTIVSTHNGNHIEPITALSLAHRSVLPGQLYFVESQASGPLALHSITTLVAGLEQLAATAAGGLACEDVLGSLAH
jgi:Lipase (class 3)